MKFIFKKNNKKEKSINSFDKEEIKQMINEIVEEEAPILFKMLKKSLK